MYRRALAELLALVVPPACAGCGSSIASLGAVLCGSCEAALPWLPAPRCPRCALPAPCGACPASGAAFDLAWAPMAHRGPARALVTALKFRRGLGCADAMAGPMAQAVAPELLAAVELVPVPRHPARRRRHGFDQAEILAAALARRAGRPIRRCLQRAGPARRQLGTGRATRLHGGRIEISATAPVPQASLLVDDVHTTGATLDACARALQAAGADLVAAVTYTRALAG